MAPPMNITSIKTSSSGVWQGDNPLHYAFPLLIIQTILVVGISRFIAFLLRPLRQPKVIAEIVGGIMLGPSALGRNHNFLNWIFPSWSSPILESVASIGLLFFLFLVGLELDLSSIRRTGRRAFPIALAGVSLPFSLAAIVTLVLRHHAATKGGFGQTLVFLGVALSITAFPVLARILAELKLLTTNVGETSMAAAAFNDVAAWVLLALAVALTGNGSNHSPLTTVWILLSTVAFVTFMLLLVRPAMRWVAKQCSATHGVMDEAWICLTFVGVMLSGFMTDLIGIHSIFGAFVFGLCIPKEGDFASRLIKRIEDFVSSLLLPLYFASSGMKTNVSKIQGLQAWGLLVLVTSTACVGKILGTFVVAMMCMIPARESLTLGLLMNTKGLVELIVLNIGREKKVLDDEMFTILVIMALFTTFMTTPMVLAIYKPLLFGKSSRIHNRHLKQESSNSSKKSDVEKVQGLRVLCCVHGAGNVPSMVNLIELIRGSKTSPLKLYAMHLVEFTDRPSSIIMVQRVRKNGLPFVNRLTRGKSHNKIAIAFEAYAEASQVTVRPTTAISGLQTMHEDICHVAEYKRTTIIILPFHKQWIRDSDDHHGDHHHHHEQQIIENNAGNGWRIVNERVLQNAPCSVAIFVDRGFGGGAKFHQHYNNNDDNVPKRICVLFFGGPDDHEALELGGRMSESVLSAVTVIRFVHQNFASTTDQTTEQLDPDEEALAEFHQRWGKSVEYGETSIGSNIVNQVLETEKSGEYDLMIVGRGRYPAAVESKLANLPAEFPELGPIGDALASTKGVLSSVLVIKQHDLALDDEASISKRVTEAV